MNRTKEDIVEEIESLQKVLRALRRRRYVLDEQAAIEGLQSRPHIITEIKTIDGQIADREKDISFLTDLLLKENTIISLGNNIIEIPEELKLDFIKRKAILSEGQNKILYYFERNAYDRSYITLESLEISFGQYGKYEIFYRLEQLRLLGFIERVVIRRGNDDSAMYRLSQSYHEKLGDFMKYTITHGDLNASNILTNPTNWIIDSDTPSTENDDSSPKK